MNDYVKIIPVNENLRVVIKYDQDPSSPTEWDNVGQIAYTSTRYNLGTECVSPERMDEIAAGIRDGSLIGLPVYAYVHSGSTISCGIRTKDGTPVFTNPFSCPWDSGLSGFVYTTREKALKEFGKKLMTGETKQLTLNCLFGEVETYDQYLQGDVYGYVLERIVRDEDGDEVDVEELDSCWGFYGIECAEEEGLSAAAYQVKQDAKESAEALHWAERGVATEA